MISDCIQISKKRVTFLSINVEICCTSSQFAASTGIAVSVIHVYVKKWVIWTLRTVMDVRSKREYVNIRERYVRTLSH
jgi:hypothetical protein